MEVLRRLPRRLVVDNLKAVVTRADRYAPTIARVFLEYAQYRGFVVDPCPAPRHREPNVERGIPYVRRDFFVISLSLGPNNSFERELRSWLAPNLLLLDDFGLHKLTARQSSDFYDHDHHD